MPLSKAELEAKCREWDVSPCSEYIPTLAMKLSHAMGRPQNALPLNLVPMERPEDKVGLGTLPLLESVGSGLPKFPSHDDIAAELDQLLRTLHTTNNMNLGRLTNVLEEGALPTTTTGRLDYEWPEYVSAEEEPVGRSAAAASHRASGLCFHHSSPVSRTGGGNNPS